MACRTLYNVVHAQTNVYSYNINKKLYIWRTYYFRAIFTKQMHLTKRECMIAELRINEVAFTEIILHLRSCPIKLINAK